MRTVPLPFLFPAALLLAWSLALPAAAEIQGTSGPTFQLAARTGQVSTPDGNSIHSWGYANGAGAMQYPGPTLLVTEGDAVEITLANELPVPTSMVFPGIEGVTTTGGTPGGLTQEAPGGGSVVYRFTASAPGTYLYYSGTQPELQVEMGLVGALIVRPSAAPGRAYDHPDAAFDQEVLFLMTEMDPRIHELVRAGRIADVDLNDYRPVYWFLNGRNAPDTMAEAGVPWLPHQPYNCMPMMHPGERLLLRLVGAGRDPHPFHPHGNHVRTIARDGRLLASAPGSGADLGEQLFSATVHPGETLDAIFEWTGAKLGWDIYGHGPLDPLQPGEYALDHGQRFPVQLPTSNELTFGESYAGSPFLGGSGVLPPGQGLLNPGGAYFYMWHSHTEKEMVNFDLFPGGMMTMLVIEPHPPVMP